MAEYRQVNEIYYDLMKACYLYDQIVLNHTAVPIKIWNTQE